MNCNVAKKNIFKIFLFRTLLFTSSWMQPIILTYFYDNKDRQKRGQENPSSSQPPEWQSARHCISVPFYGIYDSFPHLPEDIQALLPPLRFFRALRAELDRMLSSDLLRRDQNQTRSSLWLKVRAKQPELGPFLKLRPHHFTFVPQFPRLLKGDKNRTSLIKIRIK